MTQAEADRVNEAVPHPSPTCDKCGGQGSYYEPPLDVQKAQIEAGTRERTCQRMCNCFAVNQPKPAQWEAKR